MGTFSSYFVMYIGIYKEMMHVILSRPSRGNFDNHDKSISISDNAKEGRFDILRYIAECEYH